MNRPESPPNQQRQSVTSSDRAVGLGAFAALVLMVLCCAGPALVAAGALGAFGAWLGNSWVIGGAILTVLLLVSAVWQRRQRGRRNMAGPCCPPESRARGKE